MNHCSCGWCEEVAKAKILAPREAALRLAEIAAATLAVFPTTQCTNNVWVAAIDAADAVLPEQATSGSSGAADRRSRLSTLITKGRLSNTIEDYTLKPAVVESWIEHAKSVGDTHVGIPVWAAEAMLVSIKEPRTIPDLMKPYPKNDPRYFKATISGVDQNGNPVEEVIEGSPFGDMLVNLMKSRRPQ